MVPNTYNFGYDIKKYVNISIYDCSVNYLSQKGIDISGLSFFW